MVLAGNYMQNIIDAVQRALADKNYTAALMVTLTIPDICGKMEGEKQGKRRYITWFEKYLKTKYNGFLSGKDCYALRCAILHEASEDISEQSISEILQLFYFVTNGAHCNRFSRSSFGSEQYDQKEVLTISVQNFCQDFIEAVKQWLANTASSPRVQKNLGSMFKIHEPGDQMGIIRIG
ncbi:MAG: hypothetical protein RBG13Loki_2080 [Promethearchaeota archaeon CR_4]|nr:MAG: hypothetical protein RBG13Loki_2080 [Candidatus Lokiarchaeota archaeon CR_4]